MQKQQEESEQNPPCVYCGGKTNKRGHEYYATPPHRRKRVTCTQCGKTYVIENEAEVKRQEEVKEDDNTNPSD